MRAGLGEGGELAEARVRSARGEGPTQTILRDIAKMRAQGPKSLELFSVRITVPGRGRCSGVKSFEMVAYERDSFTGPVHSVQRNTGSGCFRRALPRGLVGPCCHYAAVHCERAHDHIHCRARSPDRAAAGIASSSVPRAISGPGAMNTRALHPVSTTTGAAWRIWLCVLREGRRKAGKSDENVGGRDDTAQYRPGGRSA